MFPVYRRALALSLMLVSLWTLTAFGAETNDPAGKTEAQDAADPVNWKNPYANRTGQWLKGNLHAHTKKSDGKFTLQEVVAAYETAGFDYLAITDHNRIADPSSVTTTSLTLLPGIEYTARYHVCAIQDRPGAIVYAETNLSLYTNTIPVQTFIDDNVAAGALVFVNHPDWQARMPPADEYCSAADLLRFQRYQGMEICNEGCIADGYSGISTIKWDRLLTAGRRVLGLVTHDLHDIKRLQTPCALYVRAADKSPASILAALKSGNSYGSLGLTIADIGRRDDTVFVETSASALIRFIGMHGKVLASLKGPRAEFTFKPKDKNQRHIRVECLGDAGAMAWSQPFFRE